MSRIQIARTLTQFPPSDPHPRDATTGKEKDRKKGINPNLEPDDDVSASPSGGEGTSAKRGSREHLCRCRVGSGAMAALRADEGVIQGRWRRGCGSDVAMHGRKGRKGGGGREEVSDVCPRARLERT